MQTIAMSRIAFAAFFLRRLAVATDCSAFNTKQNENPAEVARRSVHCVKPDQIAPANPPLRRVVVSDLSLISTRKTTACGETAFDLQTAFKPGVGNLTLGTATCGLKGIAWTKSDATPAATVDMRLDFAGCSDSSGVATPVPTASVMMSVVKAAGAIGNKSFVPFLKEKCSVKTTTDASSLAKFKIVSVLNVVGNGTCDGKVSNKYDDVSQEDCKRLCMASITKYGSDLAALEASKDVCRGFSHNNGTNKCETYKGDPITKLDKKSSAGWYCWNLTASQTAVEESTPAPPTPEEIAAEEAKLPKLHIAIPAHSAEVITMTAKGNKCFQPFHWITLHDQAHQPLSAQVDAADWEEFLSMIPPPAKSRLLKGSKDDAADAIEGVSVERAFYGTGPIPVPAPAPSATAITTAAPATPAPNVITKKIVKHEDCVAGEIANALFSAILVPAGTWVAIGLLFHALFPGGGKGQEESDIGVGCSRQTTSILILSGCLVAAILSFVLVAVLKFLFTPLCAASNHDVILIKLTTALSCIVATTVGLFYLSTKHHATNVAKASGDDGGKFMLLKVSGNNHTPVPMDKMHDSSSTKGGSSIFLSQS